LQEYFFVMLYKDLVERYQIANPAPVRYFIKRILENLANPTSIRKIFNEMKSQGIKVGKNTLYEVAEQTEAIYMLLPLAKYEPSLVKESNAQKKYYCIDCGLRNALLPLPREDYGALLENFVFLHLRRNMPMQRGLYYYKGKKECDFVLADNSHVKELFQVCREMEDADTRQREIAGLLEASKATSCDRLTIITANDEEDIEADDKLIKVIPAWKWSLDR
jgi:predicted AAA+ superfamily ATPase